MHRHSYGTIPILRQQNGWVGGSRKWPVLLTLSTVCIYADKVDFWVQKGKKYADLRNIAMVLYSIVTKTNRNHSMNINLDCLLILFEVATLLSRARTSEKKSSIWDVI